MDCVTWANAAKFVLQLLQSVLVWPAAALALGLLFKREIASVFRRLKTGRWGDKEVQFGELPAQADARALATKESAKDELSLDHVKVAGEGVRQAFEFERMYNSIFGSQWRFLQSIEGLAAPGRPWEDVQSFHEEETFAFAHRDFTRWYAWMLQARLIESHAVSEKQYVRLTDLGRRFVHYIKSTYQPVPPFRAY